jgi:hypothetical protein
MKLSIMIDMPIPSREKTSSHPQPLPVTDKVASVEEEVKNAIEAIDSGRDSRVEWKLLNKLCRELRKRKDPRSKNLMKLIEPVMNKYGMHGVSEGENRE